MASEDIPVSDENRHRMGHKLVSAAVGSAGDDFEANNGTRRVTQVGDKSRDISMYLSANCPSNEWLY